MSEIQSVVFLTPHWKSTPKMRSWLKKNDFKPIKRVDKVKKDGKISQYRYRIKDPKKYKSFATKKTTSNLNLVIGIK
jgi:hypothetical protein